MVRTFDTLTTLANRNGSDKGTSAHNAHRYTFLYDLLFFPLKYQPINFLEIGLAIGGPEVGGPVDRSVDSPSAAMWLEYFPAARIYGFDISDFSHMQNDRFTFIRGDAGVEDDVRKILAVQNAFDVIIDDASHASYHQQITFRALFDSVRPDGLYVIEDLQWQPDFEAALPETRKTSQLFDAYFLDGAYLENDVLSYDFMRRVRERLISYAAFPSFTGDFGATKIIVMRLGPAPGTISA